MAENIADSVRHLEKDMADILDVMNNKDTTEVILNPYRLPNGRYEGRILVDQHGKELHNYIRSFKTKIDPIQLKIGDLIIIKYNDTFPDTINYWNRLPVKGSVLEKNRVLSDCIKSFFGYKDHERVIYQSDEDNILEFAENIEIGYINSIELTEESYSDSSRIIKLINNSLPSNYPYKLGINEIKLGSDITKYELYPLTLHKNEIVKMTATKAETIMSVLASITGKMIHVKRPYLECQIPKYGHRFTGVLPPASNFPAFCIRRHSPKVYTLGDFVMQGVLQETSCETIRSWIKRKFNILIAGGTGSGKTTLANAILHEINCMFPQTRILIIEDVPELQFNTTRSIALTVNEFYSMYDALRTTLRFKPNRIVMGEVRGAEAYTLLKSWNTGHPGGLATIHANGVESALTRFESCVSDHENIKVNKKELGFTINGIISIQNLTVRELVKGEYINVVKRKITGLRHIVAYDDEKDIYQDVIYDRLEESFE